MNLFLYFLLLIIFLIDLYESCPNSMKCLRESYCQDSNPNEGHVDHFDIRLSFRKTKLKCRQENLPVDGVCCYLREDYNSQVTSNPLPPLVPTSSPKSNESIPSCGIQRNPIPTSGLDQRDTQFGEYPWQVLVGFKSRNRNCGGTIISPTLILTTASCTYAMRETDIVARVGEWDISSKLEKKQYQDVQIRSIILHPKYNHTTKGYNIAILQTVVPIKYDYHVGSLCLPSPLSSITGKRCMITGWGSLRTGGNRTTENILKQVNVEVLDESSCQRMLRSRGILQFRAPLTCAIPAIKKDACIGDEGSPLVCETLRTGEYSLAGLLVGSECGAEGLFVFSSIPNLVEFVREEVEKLRVTLDPRSIPSTHHSKLIKSN